MSTTGGTPAGTVYVDKKPRASSRSSSARRPTQGREIVSAEDKPGITNMIEILAVVRGVEARRGSSATSRARATGTSRARSAPRSRRWLAPVRERYLELREDTTAIEGIFETGAEKARASGIGGRRGCARADGRQGPSGRTPSLSFVSIAEAELDLDVFAGPFDLLLSLILREELDLLEVDLAEVVDRLPRPPGIPGASSTSRPRPSSWC